MTQTVDPRAIESWARKIRKDQKTRAIANWLRDLAERLSPDDTYAPIRGRVWLGRDGLEFEYTSAPPEADNFGVPLFIRSADRDMVVRR